MKMATKLTKAFAAFVGERGFEIANEDEISQRPGEDYKLARQIFRNKRVLLPFLTKLAVEVNAKKRTFEFHVPNAEDSEQRDAVFSMHRQGRRMCKMSILRPTGG